MRETEQAARERELLDAGVPTVRCESCRTLVARDFSWHYCTSAQTRFNTEAIQQPRAAEFFATPGCPPVPSRSPESIRYVPEWAEKL